MADSDAIYAVIASLYEANAFGFESLVPWLRLNVE
jgi:hypothetical protein